MNEDRRTLPRWIINRPAKLRLPEAWNDEDCFVEDMNLKGMCLSLSDRLTLDRTVTMVLLFPDLDFEAEVEIPWMREVEGRYVYGISFSRIKDEDKDKIYQYIYSNCFSQLKDHWWQEGS